MCNDDGDGDGDGVGNDDDDDDDDGGNDDDDNNDDDEEFKASIVSITVSNEYESLLGDLDELTNFRYSHSAGNINVWKLNFRQN